MKEMEDSEFEEGEEVKKMDGGFGMSNLCLPKKKMDLVTQAE